jgi:hypothetical protein
VVLFHFLFSVLMTCTSEHSIEANRTELLNNFRCCPAEHSEHSLKRWVERIGPARGRTIEATLTRAELYRTAYEISGALEMRGSAVKLLEELSAQESNDNPPWGEKHDRLKVLQASLDPGKAAGAETVHITVTTEPMRMGSLRVVLAETLCTVRDPRTVEFRRGSPGPTQPAVLLCFRGRCSLPLRTVEQLKEAVERMEIGASLCHDSCPAYDAQASSFRPH